MCNLYSNTTTSQAMRQLFDVDVSRDHLGNAQPRPGIHPKGATPVVALNDDGNRELVEMSWGFRTPQVSKRTGKPIKPAAWNNARDDKLMKSGLWRVEREDLLEPEHPRRVHTMVTTEANDLIRHIHARGRMPVILRPEDYQAWLAGSLDEATALIKPYPSDEMRIVLQGIGEKRDEAGH